MSTDAYYEEIAVALLSAWGIEPPAESDDNTRD